MDIGKPEESPEIIVMPEREPVPTHAPEPERTPSTPSPEKEPAVNE